MSKKVSKTPKTKGQDLKMTPMQEKEQTFELRNKHVLGTMDSLTKRMKSSAELLEKRVEYLCLVHDDDTFTLDRFKTIPKAEIDATIDSIEAIHMDFAKEYVEATNSALEAMNNLHKILNKKKDVKSTKTEKTSS